VIRNNVVVSKANRTLHCDELAIDFVDGPEGKTEIESLEATAKNNKTRLLLDEYTVICDVFQYGMEQGKNTFRLTGAPVIDNIVLPLFPSPSGEKEPSAFVFQCRDVMKITSEPSGNPTRQDFDVTLFGAVTVKEKEITGSPVLQANELTVELTRIETSDPGAAGEPSIEIKKFQARGNVSGRLDAFDLACTEFKYDFMESADGLIHTLDLLDPEKSRLSGEKLSLEAPNITVTMRPNITDIMARGNFECRTRVERLRSIPSFNLFSEEEGNVRAGGEALPGTITLQGVGAIRLLMVRDPGKVRQTVQIEDSEFEVRLFRGEDPVLHMEGSRDFSLDLLSGELSSMGLRGGGELHCPELGFSALGDVLGMNREGADSLLFFTQGPVESNHIVFVQPNDPSACTIHADRVEILTGEEIRLTASDKVVALFPSSFFKKGRETEATVSAADKETKDEPIKILSSFLTIERRGTPPALFFQSRGDVRLSKEDLNLSATCENLSYQSTQEKLTLLGEREDPAHIRIESPYDEKVFDSVTSQKVEINLRESKIRIDREGEIILHAYDPGRQSFDPILIRCHNDIVLNDNLLEFHGPVRFVYGAGHPNNTRTLTCRLMFVYFEKSPLLAQLSTWDFAEYQAMVRDNGTGPVQGYDNMIKRIKAQEEIVMDLGRYTIEECALLNWNLLKDEIVCEGLGKKVLITDKEDFTIRGSEIRLRPVNEEIRIIK
jgi:hypothetical protein